MPPTFTHGQTTKLRTINKGHFTGLAPARQVSAIRQWIIHNNKIGALSVFTINSDEDLREHVSNIAEWLGCYTANPSFQTALQSISAKAGNQYAEVIGLHGRVPADVVEEICVKYKMQRGVILDACSRFAPAQGGNGIKTVNHNVYEAELKLLPMGGERVYASTKITGKYVFNKVAKHL